MEGVFLEKLLFRILILHNVSVVVLLVLNSPIPVPACSKELVCGSSLAVNAGSNSAANMDVCLLLVFCVVR